MLQGLIGEYVITEEQGIGKAYDGREDWAPDPDDGLNRMRVSLPGYE